MRGLRGRRRLSRTFSGVTSMPKPKKAVHGLAADIQRGNAGRREYDRRVARCFAIVLEQGRFAGARLSGDEEVAPTAGDAFQRAGELGIDV